jgi:hypothetical protein
VNSAMHVFVCLGVTILPLSMIFLLDFRTVMTVSLNTE